MTRYHVKIIGGDGWYEEYTALVKYNKQLEKIVQTYKAYASAKKQIDTIDKSMYNIIGNKRKGNTSMNSFKLFCILA